MARGDKAVEIGREMRKLPVLLNPEDLQQRSDRLARLIQARAQEESDQKLAKAEMKSKLDMLASDIGDLANTVSRRHEDRDVQVVLEFLGEGMVRETRTDSGEVLITRPPEAHERQAVMAMRP